MAKFSVESVFSAVDKVTAPLKKMAKASKSFGRTTMDAMKRATLSTNRFSKANTGLMKNLATMVGAGGLIFMLSSGLRAIADANIQVDQSMASLQAITGTTDKEFKSFSKQVSEVSKAQLMFAGDTAKAFEVVASAQPELLKNADALGRVTNAAITLSKASGDDLAQSAISLTGVMNQFNLGADDSERVMNALAAGSVAGSADITKVAASMKNFGAVASGANLSVEKAVALVEVMGSKSVFAEEAGTQLRAAILNLQQAGIGYASGVFDINDALTELQEKTNGAATEQEKNNMLLKIFGKTGMNAGQILLDNIDKFEELTEAVTGTNTAVDQARIKADTLSNRFKEVSDAFKTATTTTDSQNESMQSFKNTLVFVAENMETIIGTVITLAKVFAPLIAVMIVHNAVIKTMKVLLDVTDFIRYLKTIQLISNAKKVWTAIQWGLNAAIAALPIVAIIAVIVALIVALVKLVQNWESVKEALIEGWEKVKVVLDSVWESIKIGVKTAGIFIFDFLLFPIEMVLKLVSKIPGKVGDLAKSALDSIGDVRVAIGGEDQEEERERTKVINSEASFRQQVLQQNESNVNLSIDNYNNSDIGIQTTGAPIKRIQTSMFGF